ncbi:hypothetical protein EGC76_07760 [Pseudidiomarina gelatinasegens]|jgi:phosphopantetheinyl transferase|uniref:Uncharacterized protein n=1 Tax=Pseudidiomarina gelatinasegens TaxID=2487740 RepID=A0A443YZ86_9GAMM|nr:hypothetical protein [Pseudidiomarina gelatinasegens]RWU09513.1 hypothetical protein EGC76_07760 [Pseudidiomarina gelatinasegens]
MIATAFSTDFNTVLPALDAWVTSAEQEAALLYRQQPRQQQFLAGRGFLRWLVCQQWHCAAGAVAISRQDNGAPLLSVGGQQWQCSISHTKGGVLVAASPEYVVGVDIEVVKPRRRLVELVEQYQDGFFSNLDGSDWQLFYQRWTLAEAVTKAEQGLLLSTLKRPVDDYQQRAEHAFSNGYMLCCYTEDAKPDALLREVTATAEGLVFAELK